MNVGSELQIENRRALLLIMHVCLSKKEHHFSKILYLEKFVKTTAVVRTVPGDVSSGNKQNYNHSNSIFERFCFTRKAPIVSYL